MRLCPICQTEPGSTKLFIEQNIDIAKLSSFSYASRKEPEFMCHRLVQCTSCDLVYADQPPDKYDLAQAYHVADYDSEEEANDAANSYLSSIKPVLEILLQKHSALEIGTGTGIFLEYLSNQGFVKLVGIEPSAAAINAAPDYRQTWIRKGIFEEKDFEPNSFDLICCFMTMEHVHDPENLVKSAYNLLRVGGAFVTVTHDYRSRTNRLLGKRSPIIDVEHLQLFSKQSIQQLFNISGYTKITVKSFANTYEFKYWLRLTPLPFGIKSLLLRFMTFLGIEKIKIKLNVGNIITIGFKSN